MFDTGGYKSMFTLVSYTVGLLSRPSNMSTHAHAIQCIHS